MLYLVDSYSAYYKRTHRRILDIPPAAIEEVERWRAGGYTKTAYFLIDDVLDGKQYSYSPSFLSRELSNAIPLDNPSET